MDSMDSLGWFTWMDFGCFFFFHLVFLETDVLDSSDLFEIFQRLLRKTTNG